MDQRLSPFVTVHVGPAAAARAVRMGVVGRPIILAWLRCAAGDADWNGDAATARGAGCGSSGMLAAIAGVAEVAMVPAMSMPTSRPAADCGRCRPGKCQSGRRAMRETISISTVIVKMAQATKPTMTRKPRNTWPVSRSVRRCQISASPGTWSGSSGPPSLYRAYGAPISIAARAIRAIRRRTWRATKAIMGCLLAGRRPGPGPLR